MLNCVYCGKEFTEAQKQTGRQRYCSAYCRTKQWQNDNRDAVRAHGRKALQNRKKKNPKLCKICGSIVPIKHRTKKHNSLYCSSKCHKVGVIQSHANRLASNNRGRAPLREAFCKHKESLGCSRCGYNKYGGAIDYHHINPATKALRITHMNYKSKSQMVLDELKKCVLLCKNCHYEEHAKMRENK